ncbi:class I SAM-dependent methyltransferase [bacterium]|nr:class I SAM-dependent methyltransferase [bacterium]MBU1959334.1 class I SAM-dependent methyltransferase [bacterium]
MRETHTNADMSHQNRIGYKLDVLLNSLRANGFLLTLRKMFQRIYLKIKGVDFSTQNIYDLTRTGEYQEHGTALVSSSKDFLIQLIKDLESVIETPLCKELFIDYGSGKGAAIIHAKKIGFKQSIGVEFAKELHETAVENIKKMKLENVESLYADAATYVPPKNVSVIYFFNPFDEVVMQKVIENILEHKASFENEVYIIYANASCKVLKDRLTLLKEVTYPSGSTADFFKV